MSASDTATRGPRRSNAIEGAVGTAVAHDSAVAHVTGQALYTDDVTEPRGTLHAAVGLSEQAHARVLRLDLAAVRAAPDVLAVMQAEDVPGENNFGALYKDDPIFAPGLVSYAGQALFAVAARSVEAARRAVRLAVVEYAPLPAILDLDAAVAAGSFVLPSERIERGSPDARICTAPYRRAGRLQMGGQDQFYLEGQIALATPREGGDMHVLSSTQHPGEVQLAVAHALARSAMDVTVECRRMGGGFGGKESQPAQIACIAALLSAQSGRAVKLRLDRDVDMLMTGKRHDFVVDYDVGFDTDGRILGIELVFASRCGNSADLSGPVNDRTMFHCDNAYYLEHVRIVSHRCKTNTVSNTAFRGFGGPQGMFAIEYVIDEIARALGADPLAVRKLNFYGVGHRNVTPYLQTIEDNILEPLVADLEKSADYWTRRAAIAAFNATGGILKKGIALTPVKFGISFTATHLNQAGALVHVYTDGSVHLNHGGTEMGQGLFTKVAQIVASELQIDIGRIKLTAADTGKVPNASATAASSGADLNGKAAQAAARTIKDRLRAVAAGHFGVPESGVEFQANAVRVGSRCLDFTELVRLAYLARVSLSATGFYRTPKIHYDRATFSGRPFYYFAYGAAVSEVLVDTLTGEYRVSRVDILHDCGVSLNPAIDRGQVEGGFIQGMGWLTGEELSWNARGELQTHAPSTYKIPVCSDLPHDFRVRLLESGHNREPAVYRSKAVGEPPLMLAISVFQALKDAVLGAVQPVPAAPGAMDPPAPSAWLRAPATPEAVLLAIDELRARVQDQAP